MGEGSPEPHRYDPGLRPPPATEWTESAALNNVYGWDVAPPLTRARTRGTPFPDRVPGKRDSETARRSWRVGTRCVRAEVILESDKLDRDVHGVGRRQRPAVHDVRDVAALTGVSVSKLNLLRLQGGGPRFMRFGRSVRYTLAEVISWANRPDYARTAEADTIRNKVGLKEG